MMKQSQIIPVLAVAVLMFTVIGISYYGMARNFSSPAWSEMWATTTVTKEQRGTTQLMRELNQDDNCASIKTHTSEWFRSMYNESINPFWTADNINLTEGVLKWWLWLQHSKPTDFKSLFDKLYHAGVPKNFKKIKSKTNDKCITCAVIGNSVNLNNSRYGQVIDGHDAVIRINQGPTKGFTEDVGSITTHRLYYPESAVHLASDTSLVFVPFKVRDMQWLLSTLTTGEITFTSQKVISKLSCNASNIAILHPEFLRYIHTNLLHSPGRQPSTGFIGVVLALHICDKVDIYGFGADKNGGWQHYWEHLSSRQALAHKAGGVHKSGLERDFLDKLASEGIVKFYHGSENF